MPPRKREHEFGTLDGLPARNQLKQWMIKNSFFQSGSTRGRDYTHTFMNGGTAAIPDEKYATFLCLYANELDQRARWAISECATRFSRLFFDLDIEETQFDDNCDISLKRIEEWVRLIQETVLRFFPSANENARTGQVIVLAAPTGVETRVSRVKRPRSVSSLTLTEKVRTGREPSQAEVLQKMRTETAPVRRVRKTGIHLIFPNIVCDLNQMLDVRAEVLRALHSRFPPPGDDSWSKVLDAQVYTHTGGLRMPGSLKVRTCSSCRADDSRRRTCTSCAGNPREWVHRPYSPILVLVGTGRRDQAALDALGCSYERMIRWCTIRRPDVFATTPEFVIPDGVQSYVGPRIVYEVQNPSPENMSWTNAKRKANFGNRSRRASSSSSSSSSSASAQTLSETGGESIDDEKQMQSLVPRRSQLYVYGPDDEVCRLWEHFIRKYTYRVWNQVSVYEVRHVETQRPTKRSLGHRSYIIKVRGPGSRHCLNKRGEHNSAPIYFYADKNGVEQRCFCRCDTVANRVAKVPCKEFKSDTCEYFQYEFGRGIFNRFFPMTYETQAVQQQRFSSPQAAMKPTFERHPDSAYPSLAKLRQHNRVQKRVVGLGQNEVVALEAELAEHGGLDEDVDPNDTENESDTDVCLPTLSALVQSATAENKADELRPLERSILADKEEKITVRLLNQPPPVNVEHYKHQLREAAEHMKEQSIARMNEFLGPPPPEKNSDNTTAK